MPGTGEPDRTGTLPFAATGGDRLALQIALPPRWQVARPLGAGGQAEVWLAHDRELDEWVAVKVFHGDISEIRRERMRREVKLGRTLSHPNLVRVYELIEAGEHIAVAMEWVREGSLAAHPEDGPLAIGRVIAVADEVLSVLSYLHGKGIVHRDVKPSNLLLDERGSVRLADLGLVLPLESGSDLTTTAMTVGTPGYMSPEQIRGADLGPASDLYSLGVTLFHLLTGRVPFGGQSGFEVADRHLHEAPASPRVLRPECPAWLARFVLRLLEKSPRDRWPDAAHALDALRRRRVFASPRFWRRAAAATVGVVALGTAGSLALRSKRPVPAAVRVSGSRVVASDASGNDLWSRDFPGEQPFPVVGDFLGGRGPQVVVGAGRPGRPAAERDLMVLSADGRERERVASVGGVFRTYFPDLADRAGPCFPSAIDLDGDRRPELVWITLHQVWYPSVLGAWNPHAGLLPGPLLINSGTIHSVDGADLDGDGRNELIVLGIDNPIGWQPFVAVVKAQATEAGAYAFGVSPDQIERWARNDSRAVVAYTPLGSAVGRIRLVSAGSAGIVVDVDGRRVPLDPQGNPEGSPLFGAGGGARNRVWSELSTVCLDVASGEVDPLEPIASFRVRNRVALEEPPMRRAAALLLARALGTAGRHAAAVELLRRELAESPADADLLLRLGEQLAVSGDRNGAVAAFERGCRVHRSGRDPLDAATAGGELASLAGDAGAFETINRLWLIAAPDAEGSVRRELTTFWMFCRGKWGDRTLDPRKAEPMLPVGAVLRVWAQLERGAAPAAVADEAESMSAEPELRDAARLLVAAALQKGGRPEQARAPAEQALAELRRRARLSVEALCLVGLAERVDGDIAAALGDREAASRHWAASAREAPAAWFGGAPAPAR